MSSNPSLTSLSIFMPAFNEEDNITQTAQEAAKAAQKYTDTYEVLIINDGSKDQTAQKVQALSQKNSNIKLISHKKNRGYGAAVKTGLNSVKYEWVFFTDSDGQFKFDELDKFVENQEKADFIIGYRKKRQDPLHRIILAQIMLKIWNRIFFGLKVKDVDCAYKLFPKKLSDSIKLKTESAITVTELLVKAKNKGHTFYQIPVTHYPRKHGVQTGGNPLVIAKAAFESFKLFLDLKINS